MELGTRTRIVEEQGIMLPWEWRNAYAVAMPERYPEGDGYKSGTVFVTLETLEELSEQGNMDSHFGDVLLLDFQEGCALVAAGYAVKETRGGYHGTDKLRRELKAWHNREK